jgi:hypothetical protein
MLLTIICILKKPPEAFILNKLTSQSMNKKLVLIILISIVIIGVSATLIAINPSTTILPIPAPTSSHFQNGNRSNIRGMSSG